jgi:TRAP-type C4-dicarboxylate transport system permease small subunit
MPSETAARTGILALYLVAILSLALAPLLMPAGYDWVRHTTSESAAQGLDGAWLARLGFVAFGLAVLMVATAAFSTRPWDPELPYSRVEDLCTR